MLLARQLLSAIGHQCQQLNFAQANVQEGLGLKQPGNSGGNPYILTAAWDVKPDQWIWPTMPDTPSCERIHGQAELAQCYHWGILPNSAVHGVSRSGVS